MKPEEKEAVAFVEAFRLQWPKLWEEKALIHIPNEAGARGKDLGAFLGMIQKRRRMGTVDGCADYFLAVTTHGYEPGMSGLFLELKAPGGPLKPTQLAFLESKVGSYACCFAWGWRGAMTAVRSYLAEDYWGGVQGFVEDQQAPIAAFTLSGKVRRTKANGEKNAG